MRGETQVRNPDSFIMGISLPAFALVEDIFSIINRTRHSRYLYLPRSLAIKHLCKDIQNKGIHCLCSQEVQKYKKSIESFLPTEKYC